VYRERYREFLKIDFPRVPYPESAEEFWRYVETGGKLRRLHLMEGVEPEEGLGYFPVSGSNEVLKVRWEVGRGRVYINESQYFEGVPVEVWEFYIGGYQPCQKWLKDRKGEILRYEDIIHYQKIVRVLKETREIMSYR
jgi:predicted helicase